MKTVCFQRAQNQRPVFNKARKIVALGISFKVSGLAVLGSRTVQRVPALPDIDDLIQATRHCGRKRCTLETGDWSGHWQGGSWSDDTQPHVDVIGRLPAGGISDSHLPHHITGRCNPLLSQTRKNAEEHAFTRAHARGDPPHPPKEALSLATRCSANNPLHLSSDRTRVDWGALGFFGIL